MKREQVSLATLIIIGCALLAIRARSQNLVGTARTPALSPALTILRDAANNDAQQLIPVGAGARVRTCFGFARLPCGAVAAGDPRAAGLKVLAELVGPGIPRPITLQTAPGGTFALPALSTVGEYRLENIRLVRIATGETIGSATPSRAVLHVGARPVGARGTGMVARAEDLPAGQTQGDIIFTYDTQGRLNEMALQTTPAPTVTLTPTPVPPTATFTRTPTRTFTAIPPTATFTRTPTRTFTPIGPTATFTRTPTRTFTPIPPTATSTRTPTRTLTPIPPTATSTRTPTRTPTRTNTPGSSYSISGSVTDIYGMGLIAKVTAGTAWAMSNSLGDYTINGLPNGTYTVKATKAGYVFAPDSQSVTISGASVDGISFVGERYIQGISGTVTLDGVGLSAVTIDAGVASTATDADGTFAIALDSLTAGTYTLIPRKAGFVFSPATRSVNFRGARVVSQNFTATQFAYSISGRVTQGGAALPGVEVSAGGQTVATDGAGEYVIAALPPGAYTVTAVKGGCTFAPALRTVTVGPDQAGQDFVASCLSP